MYSIACYEEECYKNGWLMNNLKYFIEQGIYFDEFYCHSVHAIYYTLSIVLYAKHSTVIEYLMHEKIVKYITTFLAYCVFSIFFAEICAAMVTSLELKQQYREYIAIMKVFLKRFKIHSDLKMQFTSIIKFKWIYNKGVAYSGIIIKYCLYCSLLFLLTL